MARFRIAVAGCGSMSHAWVKYALSREDAQIVALVDINEQSARAMAVKYSINCGIFTEIGEAIRATGANLLMDVTVPAAHMNITIEALGLGCDVLGEKPMASSLEDARKMMKTAQDSGRSYAVMQNRRFLKNIRAYKELIDSGAIGKPGFVCADFFLGPHFGGFRDLMDHPLILDMAIHTFDQARFLIGSDPVSVYCQEFNPAGSWYKGNAAAVCIFEFADGSVFCYRGSWCAEGSPTSWESAWRIMGSSGTAIWDGFGSPFCEQVSPSAEQKFLHDFVRQESASSYDGREGHEGCLDEMFGALTEGRLAETDCADNIKSVAMVFGAIESAKKGTKVVI